MNTLYYTKQTKRGKWRLYKIEAQAITAWRGSNDKTSVIRDSSGRIIEHDYRHTLVGYCQDQFGVIPFQEQDVD